MNVKELLGSIVLFVLAYVLLIVMFSLDNGI